MTSIGKTAQKDPRGPRAHFGRRTGKTLHPGQKARFETLLPDIEIDAARPVDPRALFPSADNIHLEIGYGGGEHLVGLAARTPGDGFIGCEVFTGGIAKCLDLLARAQLTNVRHFSDDAIKLLAALPENGLDVIHTLYPDPWPKKRHNKRRLIQHPMLEAFARVLKPGGTLRVATDIEDYANWTLAHVLARPEFVWPAQPAGAWHTPYPDWEPTRYEAKARREGRTQSFYFTFVRR